MLITGETINKLQELSELAVNIIIHIFWGLRVCQPFFFFFMQISVLCYQALCEYYM